MSELIKSTSTDEQIPTRENIDINPESYIPDEKQLLQMTSLLEILKTCKITDINPIVLGGYGLDGMYGKLTRDHDDIDMLVDDKQLEKMAKIMNTLGYRQDPNELDKAVFKTEFNNHFKIEFAGISTLLNQFSYKDKSYFIPDKSNAILNGQPFKAITLRGQKEIIEIQNLRAKQKGWGPYPLAKRQNQSWLINILKQRGVI